MLFTSESSGSTSDNNQAFSRGGEQQREQSVECKVERRGVEERPKNTFKLYESLCIPDYLVYCDRPRKGSVLDERDYLVAHRCQNPLYDLKQDYAEKYLRLCHAEDLTCLILAARDAFDPAAVDLGEVACIIVMKATMRARIGRYLP